MKREREVYCRPDGSMLMIRRNIENNFKSSLYLMLLLFLLVYLASCYPEFKNPIPPPPELKPDNKILGTWIRTCKSDQDEYKEQVSIFPRSSGWVDVVWIYDIDKKGSGDGINLLILEGYSTSVKKQQFLCLRFREKDFNNLVRADQKDRRHGDKRVEQEPFTAHWIIANYETTNINELVIKPFSTRRIEELIEKGRLKGEVVKGELFNKQEPFLDKVTITSSSDELAEVISDEGAGAFILDDMNDTLRFMNVLVFSKLGK